MPDNPPPAPAPRSQPGGRAAGAWWSARRAFQRARQAAFQTAGSGRSERAPFLGVPTVPPGHPGREGAWRCPASIRRRVWPCLRSQTRTWSPGCRVKQGARGPECRRRRKLHAGRLSAGKRERPDFPRKSRACSCRVPRGGTALSIASAGVLPASCKSSWVFGMVSRS